MEAHRVTATLGDADGFIAPLGGVPRDTAATIYRALGVDPATELRDRLGRPLRLCTGETMTPLYTSAPI